MFGLFSFEIRKRRDFGEVIGDAFTFVMRNIKGLLRGVVIIAGLVLIATAAYSAFYQVTGSSVSWFKFLFSNNLDFRGDVVFMAVLEYSFLQLSTAVLQTVLLDYTKLTLKYPEKKITASEIWNEAKRDLWKVVLLYMINLLITAATVGLLFVFASAHLVFLIPFLILLYLYICLRLIFSQTACVIENCNVFKAISYSWYYSRSGFWVTLGAWFVLLIITAIIGYAFTIVYIIPFIIRQFFPFMFGTFAMQVIYFLISLFIIVASRVVSLFLYSGIAMQYFSIVEKKEGAGLREKLDLIGKVKPRQFWSDERY